MYQKRNLRKSLGITLVGVALIIFCYLAWFYFVMPRLITNQRVTLEQTFSNTHTPLSLNQVNIKHDVEGIVSGGIFYPFGHANTNNEQTRVITLAEREERRAKKTVLSIPDLNIHNALVRFDVDGTNEGIYNTVLREAVAHFANTAYPGEKGNVFLFGHSKLPILAGTDYESIFTNLPRLKNGSIVTILQEDTVYKYRVNSTAVLSPKDVFVLHQPEHERLLTLMTCIPPGFNSSRYVAVASLVGVDSV